MVPSSAMSDCSQLAPQALFLWYIPCNLSVLAQGPVRCLLQGD